MTFLSHNPIAGLPAETVDGLARMDVKLLGKAVVAQAGMASEVRFDALQVSHGARWFSYSSSLAASPVMGARASPSFR